MTFEEINHILQMVAMNQAGHDQAFTRIEIGIEEHSRAIKEIDQTIAVLTKSIDDQKIRHDDLMKAHEVAEARFQQFQMRFEEHMEFANAMLARISELSVNANQTYGRLERIETNLERLSESQIKTDELIKALVDRSAGNSSKN